MRYWQWMQKHSKRNWISGELVIRQINRRTSFKGIFTSNLHFLGRKNWPRKSAAHQTRMHKPPFACHRCLSSFLPHRILQTWVSNLQWREGILYCLALFFSTMNLIYGHYWAKLGLLSLTQSSAHRPTHSRSLCCMFWSCRHRWPKRPPRSFASQQCIDCRSLRLTHLTTQFLMQRGKRPKVKVYPVWSELMAPAPFKGEARCLAAICSKHPLRGKPKIRPPFTARGQDDLRDQRQAMGVLLSGSIKAAKEDRKELEMVPVPQYYPPVALTQTLPLGAEPLSHLTTLQKPSIPTSMVPWHGAARRPAR